MVLQIVQHTKFCSEFGIILEKIIISPGSIIFIMSRQLGLFGNFWHELADQSSLEDQDKQQRSFFIIRFPVKYSDRLVTTTLLRFSTSNA